LKYITTCGFGLRSLSVSFTVTGRRSGAGFPEQANDMTAINNKGINFFI